MVHSSLSMPPQIFLLEKREAQQLQEAAANLAGLGEAFMLGFFLQQWSTALSTHTQRPRLLGHFLLSHSGQDT